MRKLLMLCGVVGLMAVTAAPAQASYDTIHIHYTIGVQIAGGGRTPWNQWCDAGQQITGGGYWVSRWNMQIGESAPTYSSGSGLYGWRVQIRNPNSTLEFFNIWALCLQ